MINISDIYKKLKESELDFFEDGGTTHLPIPDFLNDEEDTFDTPFNLPSEADIAYAMNYRDPNELQAFSQDNRAGVMMPEFDLSQGNTSSTFYNPNVKAVEEELTLAQKIQKSLGITIPETSSNATSTNGNTEKGHTDKNYDNLSFAEAWKQARSAVGPKGTFSYKGKRFTTQSANDGQSSSSTNSGYSGLLSGEQTDYNNLVKIVESGASLANLKGYSKQMLNAILENNVGSGEAQELVKRALSGGTYGPTTANTAKAGISQIDLKNLSDISLPKKRATTQQPASTKTEKPKDAFDARTGMFKINGVQYTRERLNATNSILSKKIKDLRNKGEFDEARDLEKTVSKNTYLMNNAQKEKNKLKIKDMKLQGENVIFNGKRYNLRNMDANARKNLLNQVKDSEDGWFNSSGTDRLEELSRALYNKTPVNKREGLSRFEDGGELEQFAYGGQPLPVKNFGALSSIVDPTTGQVGMDNPNQGLQLTPKMDAMVKATGQNQFRNFIGENGKMRIEGSGDQGLNIVTAENNLDRYYIDEATGQYKPIRIQKGQMYDGGLDAIYNTQDVQNTRSADDERRFNQQMGFLGQLQNGQQYDTSEDFRMLGQGLAFNAKDNAKYTNDTDRGIATGLNTAKTVAAGLDLIVGGARELYGGFATQKRQQNVEDSFYRKQRSALENQQNRYANGGRINDLLAMFEEGGDNPNDYTNAYEEQDNRPQLSPEELLTGEFIQQAQPQAGVTPNAEVENKEFIQHPDGEVQKVVGRPHSQGGERLSLEPGTTVISDKVKLGAKNAKMINNQYDLKVKAGDTFASVVDKYTKKVGLNKLNDEQTKYFSQLEKVTDQEQEEQTSELNNSFLSKKINDLENKKTALESSRTDFTSYIYNIQEASKLGRGREARIQEGDSYAAGGQISYHADGKEVPEKPKGMSSEEYLRFLENQMGLPGSEYKDTKAQAKRLKYILSLYGQDISEDKLSTQAVQDNVAGNLQQEVLKNNRQMANHYSLNVAPTQQGLQTALDTGLVSDKDLTALGVKIKNGKILIGSLGDLKGSKSTEVTKLIKERGAQNPESLKTYVDKNFNDNKWYYRFPELNTINFNSSEDETKFLSDGKYEVVDDAEGNKTYYSNKQGQYFKTTVGAKTPESSTIKDFKAPKKSTYQAPFLPSQRPVAPSPASPVPVYQTRLDRIDPVNLGYDQQVSEINRQSNAVVSQMEGLTDSQRISALSNLTANTQKNVSDVVNSTAVQNAMNQFQVQQANIGQSNSEEQSRLGNAKYSDELWMKTEANQEADNRDYQEALQKVQLGKFRYLQKHRQTNDIIENFKVGADGGIGFDQSTGALLATTPSGDQVMQDARGRLKVVKTTKTDSNGNTVSGSTSITKQP